MATIENIPIADLLSYRDSFTRPCGFAGVPITQMWPIYPLVQRILAGDSEPKPDDTFYQTIQGCVKIGVISTHSYAKLKALALDIKANGVREPVTGWRINKKVELWGGHHRACIAAALGMPTLPVKLYPLDKATDFNCNYAPVVATYDSVRTAVRLQPGESYNPVVGLTPRRHGWDRAAMLYEEIIGAKGSTVLDAGCNDGFFGAFLLIHGFDVCFLDYDANILKVAKARCGALRSTPALDGWVNQHVFVNDSLPDFVKRNSRRFDIVLFTDVMQHIASASGANVALDVFTGLLRVTNEYMIFSPGRKDVLERAGVTERSIFTRLQGHRMKYLGKDIDGPGYGREMYLVYA